MIYRPVPDSFLNDPCPESHLIVLVVDSLNQWGLAQTGIAGLGAALHTTLWQQIRLDTPPVTLRDNLTGLL